MAKQLIRIAFCALLVISACNKAEFLNENPNGANVVPRTWSDLQAIMDRDIYVNGIGTSSRGPVPFLGETGADNYFLPDDIFNDRISPEIQDCYVWKPNALDGLAANNWNYPYLVVYYSNIVLDGLSDLNPANQKEEYDILRGSALFHRAHAWYQLAQVFAPPYDKGTDNADIAIPLPKTPDINAKLQRASLVEVYTTVINDLEESILLLPDIQAYKTRPSKQAVYGLLARIHQTMQDYASALAYADSCLEINNTLLDYNTLDGTLSYPFENGPQHNPEVIFNCNMTSLATGNPVSPVYARVNEPLYQSYGETDLRKQIFFRSTSTGMRFKGSYQGTTTNFAGIAIDEVVLIRAECYARQGKVEEALNDLNYLIANRTDNSKPLQAYQANNADEALAAVLTERRKELIFRGLRWTDLRRLNIEGHNMTLRRTVNGTEYVLPPNGTGYTYPIPAAVLGFYD